MQRSIWIWIVVLAVLIRGGGGNEVDMSDNLGLGLN